MNTNDWLESPMPRSIHMYSFHGIPYPLDEYYKLIGKPTTTDMAKVCEKWGYGERK